MVRTVHRHGSALVSALGPYTRRVPEDRLQSWRRPRQGSSPTDLQSEWPKERVTARQDPAVQRVDQETTELIQ
jgi:hypothetical protein